MSRPSLAVIISTIEENLNSFITNFSFKNLKNADEVIIVIQGLKEKSVIPELSSFKVINDENYGLSSSRNIGIKNSSCDFIWFLDDDVVLIDEVHTCDSSRYWFAKTYEERFAKGKEPDKYDKDVVRDYIKKTVDDPYKHTEFTVPDKVKDDTTQVYVDFYRCLTGDDSELTSLNEDIENPVILNQETEELIDHFYYEEKECILRKLGGVVILAGSQSDEKHVEKIKESLRKQKIVVYNHYASAHKNTEVVLSLLKSYNEMKGRIVYVTVAGRSNALSGVVACNTQYPTIACPPFSDKDDFMVNINSTLQMPSNVPVMTILEPVNVALSIKRMLTL